MTGAEMVTQDIQITIILMAIALLLLQNKFLPSSIFLVLFGFFYSIATRSLSINDISFNFSLPQLSLFTLNDMIYGFIYAGFAQLFLTLTNAVVATITLIHDLFPGREDVTPQTLIQNMGAMNVITPFIGGMPLCHGAGGLAAQYLFGARTGGAILMEGLLEVSLGLFFSDSLLAIFTSYPSFIVGIMLILTSMELGKVVFNRIEKVDVSVLLFTAIISTAFNIAFGFFFGLLLYLAIKRKLIKL
jgi:hypothetical protein